MAGRTERHWPWWLAGLYCGLAIAWILASDRLLAGLGVSAGRLQQLQSVKGVLFVLATGVLLFLLARRAIVLLSVDRDLVKSLLDSAPVAIVAVDLDGTVRLWNAEAERMFGWTAGEILGRPNPIVPSAFEDEYREHLSRTADGVLIRAKEVQRRHRDGRPVEAELSNAAVVDARGQVVGAMALMTDIGARKRGEQTRRLHAAALEATASAVLLADISLEVQWTNRAFRELTGHPAEESIGRSLPELLWGGAHHLEKQRLEAALAAGESFRSRGVHRRRDDSSYLAELTVSPVRDDQGHATHVVAVHEDISETMYLAEQLRFLASYDELTQLPNRALFLDRVKEMAEQAVGARHELALAVGRIDRFHRLRQSLGRRAADELVKVVGTRLRESLESDGELAAFGGGLFALAKLSTEVDDYLPRVLQRLRRAVEVPLLIGGTDVYPQVTFGCAIFPRDATTFEETLHRAETALSLGIEHGSPIFLFEDRLQTSIEERVFLEGELRAALSRRELFLEYQPVYDLYSGGIALAEALVRWRHPRHGVLPPGRFLPAAEEAGLVPRLDLWVLRRALGEWQRGMSGQAGAVAVNLGARTLEDGNLLVRLEDLIRSTGVRPGDLVLEITESAAMRDPERSMALLEQLRDRGFRIAIDDFGVAYSSLNYLRRLPAQFLKIDRTFVSGLGAIQRDERLVEAILALAEDYGMEVIAEGVEQPAQLDWLRHHGCRYAQGFLLARPCAAGDLVQAVASGG